MLIQSGVGVVGATVDPSSVSLRVNNRPIISATLGSYQCSLRGTNVAASAAGSSWWEFRYTGSNLCLVTKVIFDGCGVSTVMAAANAFGIGLSVGRSYTVSPTTGITSAVLTGNNCKLRTSYATTGVGAIAIANGANITGQTRTLDSQPAGSVVNGLLAPLGSGIAEATLFDAYLVGHPIILANNEGLALTNLVTLPATGVINFGITVQWNEVTAGEWV